MKNLRLIPAIILIATSAIYVGCSNTEAKKGVGIDAANFDSTISPTKDFFLFANGGWIKANPIPSDQVRWGSFSILSENNKKNLYEIAKAAAAKTNSPKGSTSNLRFQARSRLVPRKGGYSACTGVRQARTSRHHAVC